MSITIGHDSEFGLKQGRQVVSALDAFDETVFEDENGRYFADNMNCEIAINPVDTLAAFHAKTDGLLNHVRDQGYDLIMEPVVVYPDRCLSHPLAMISGCNPDMSAYLMENNVPPDFAALDGTRSCGAHVHTGDKSLDPFVQAKWMDAFLTLPLMLEETPNDRRSMYGGAGCIRVKPYGMEYRSLSNVWLDDKARREFVWEGTHKAMEKAKTSSIEEIEDWWDIPAAIDTHDIELAKRTLDRLYIYGVTSL